MNKAHFVEDDILERNNHKYKRPKSTFPILTFIATELWAAALVLHFILSWIIWLRWGLGGAAFWIVIDLMAFMILGWYAAYNSQLGRWLRRRELI